MHQVLRISSISALARDEPCDLREGIWLYPRPQNTKEALERCEERCEGVRGSWDQQLVLSEETSDGRQGLRSAQIGAIYATLAHWKVSREPATIVLPTGTGKTETMLALLVKERLERLLVVVPTEALREQISSKFLELGILRRLGVLGSEAQYPVVGTLKRRPRSIEEVDEYFSRCNVIVTTMSVVGACDSAIQGRIASLCSHLFIDEAHHILATTWDRFKSSFESRVVLQFSTSGSTLVLSTYLGGPGTGLGTAYGVAVTGSNNVLVFGLPREDFLTKNAYQPQFGGGTFDTFVMKVVDDTKYTEVVPVPGTNSRSFAETGKIVTGLFLDYWNNNGGLAQQGFPISDLLSEVSDLDGKTYTVQYFERAVFEYHPEITDPKYHVLLSQLGTFQYRKKYPTGAPNQQPNTSAGSMLFQQTNKRLGGKFLAYWQSHGGLAQQGYPISDEFIEKSDLDGKEYRVQYFERAVFELHPENVGTQYEVLLSQLGTFRYKEKYGGR